MPLEFEYKHNIVWKREKIGDLKKQNFPTIEVATPPEFKGHENIWSPEDLFVASINSCFMATFLNTAIQNDFRFISYAARANGILSRAKSKNFEFEKIIIEPVITVADENDVEKAKNILKASEDKCFIANSIKSEVIINPKFLVETRR